MYGTVRCVPKHDPHVDKQAALAPHRPKPMPMLRPSHLTYSPYASYVARPQIALDIGFDTEHGRLDVSVHPFTGGAHPTDVRMTTRFKKEDVTEGITGGSISSS